jgi:hypothetical protein
MFFLLLSTAFSLAQPYMALLSLSANQGQPSSYLLTLAVPPGQLLLKWPDTYPFTAFAEAHCSEWAGLWVPTPCRHLHGATLITATQN